MADDEIDYAATDDDFHSQRNISYDDYWRLQDNDYSNENYQFGDYDGRQHSSSEKTTSWLDQLLSNTTSDTVNLTPVEDINPDK